jgi:hypothetical protein
VALQNGQLGVEPVLELPDGRGLADEAARVVGGLWICGRERRGQSACREQDDGEDPAHGSMVGQFALQ